MFGSPRFLDINDDQIPDVLIGGRCRRELRFLDGASGALLWEYFSEGDRADSAGHKLGNSYNPQWIPDLDGRSVAGYIGGLRGLRRALPSDPNRPPVS